MRDHGGHWAYLYTIGLPAAALAAAVCYNRPPTRAPGPPQQAPQWSVPSGSKPSRLTPSVLAGVLANAGVQPPPPIDGGLLARRAELEKAAALAAWGGHHAEAAAQYRDALELDPSSTAAHDGLMGAFAAMFGGPSSGPQADRNRSEDFALAMGRSLERGEAEQLSADPPIFVLKGVLTPLEAQALLRVREARRRPWEAVPPLVCFDHPAFQGAPELQPYLLHGLGGFRSRSCLNQTASAAAAAAIRCSDSLALYAGEEPLVDEVGRRLQAMAGLDPLAAINFQLLTYADDAAYHEHTDCAARDDLLDHVRGATRMASVLIYLSDDFEEGETYFSQLGLKVRPDVGSAVVFYSYHSPAERYGGRACDPRTRHLARAARGGVKHVLQRWYSYRSDRFFDVRPWRRQNDVRLRRPWQPVIKCDHVENTGHRLDAGGRPREDVSCRWYNKPYDFAFEL